MSSMRKIYQFADPIRGVEARHGFLLYNQYDAYIGRSLEHYGEYCEGEVELFGQLIRPADVVWEIGSNTGSQSTALSRLVPEGQFVGFEPQIELFKIFTANLALNNCENARPMCFALGEEDGLIELPKLNYHGPNNFGAMSLLGDRERSSHKVEVRTIDSFDWLPQPNFIKIDVEGMEVSVLRGGRETITRQRPLMYVENDRAETSEPLIEALWDLDYKLYFHTDTYFRSPNFFGNESNLFPATISLNMICIPKERPFKINLDEITDKAKHPFKGR